MEASLLQVYAPRDPLAEYLRGQITFRKLRVMVEGIPFDPSTPVGRAINGPWGTGEHLMAHAVDASRTLATAFYNHHRKQGQPTAEVDLLSRPKLTRYQRKAEQRARRAERRVAAADIELMRQIEQRRRG